MATITSKTLVCDRCGHSEAELEATALSPFPLQFGGWGYIAAAGRSHEGPKLGVGSNDDLCPGCLKSLFAWWQGVDEPVAQPEPPAPPPPPIFTVEHRRLAVERATEMLGEQVATAVEAIREQPTIILSGEVVPGALHGIEERADKIVMLVLDQLGLGPKRRRKR